MSYGDFTNSLESRPPLNIWKSYKINLKDEVNVVVISNIKLQVKLKGTKYAAAVYIHIGK